MRKFFKITGITLLLIIALLIILPYAFKGKIMTVAKTELNKMLNARVDFADLNLSFIKGFPNVYIGLEKLSVVGVDKFEGDTLIAFRSFGVKVDLMSILRMKNINVKSILIDHPVVNALVLKNGKANWDIMKDTTKTKTTETTPSSSATKFSVKLKKFEIRSANIKYKDESLGMEAVIRNLDFFLAGNLASDFTTLRIEAAAKYFSFLYGGVRYINSAAIRLKAKVDADLKKYIFTLKDNELGLNEIALGLNGRIEMPAKGMIFDLAFESKKTDFKSLLSMIPAIYMTDFKGLQASGTMKIEGTMKGEYIDSIMPSVNLTLQVNDGKFKYPELPSSIDNVNVDMRAHYDGKMADSTTIDIKRFHLELAQNPFDMTLSVRHPMTDPLVKGNIAGKIDLTSVLRVVHIDSTELSGMIEANVSFMGRVSSVEKQKYQDFKAEGLMAVTALKYKSPALRAGLVINKSKLVFSPQYLDLQSFDMKIGKSDIQLTGKITDFMSYAFSKGTLRSDFRLTSAFFDANELLSGFPTDTTKKTADTTQLTVFGVPARIHATFAAVMTRLLYSNMEINNIKGLIEVVDQRAILKNLVMNMLEGNVLMNGEYNTKDIKKPLVDLNLKISEIDIPSAFKTFNTVKKLAPVAGNIKGRISSVLSFTSLLDKHMNPVYASANGKGNLSTRQVEIIDSKTLTKLGEKLKSNKFKSLVLKDVNINFIIKDGRIKVEPFITKIGSGKLTVAGDQGIDQTLNYNMIFSMPRSEMGIANEALQGLQGAAAAKGLKINLAENVKLGVKVTGTFTNPVVSPELSQAGTNVMQGIKEMAKEKITATTTEVKQEVKQKANVEAEKLLKQAQDEAQAVKDAAQKAAAEVRQQANTNADKLEKEAQGQPKFLQNAAKKAGDKVRQEGENKAQKIIKEADTKAEAILSKAKTEADKLK